MGSREETQEQGAHVWCNLLGELLSATTNVFGVLGTWSRSRLSEMILLMYLTVVMLSKPLEKSNELD